MKIANIENQNLHIFGATCVISTKVSGKMLLVILLKVAKKQNFTLSLENRVLGNHRRSLHDLKH